MEKLMRDIELDVKGSAKKPASGTAKQSPAEALASIQQQLERDAEVEKQTGNTHFHAGNYKAAVESYSNAILMNRRSAVLHANRAMAYLKLQAWSDAEADCTTALSFDATFVKAYARRAHARLQQKKISAALEDFDAVLRLEPMNKEAQEEIRKLRQSASASATPSVVPKVATAPPSPSPAKAPPMVAASLTPSPASVAEPAAAPKVTAVPPNSSSTASVPPKPQQAASLTATTPAPQTPAPALQPLFPTNPKQKPKVVELADSAPRPKQVTLPTVKAPVSAKLHRVVVTPEVPTEPPTSAFEFERSWHALQGHPELFAQYFKLIPPSSFQRLFSLSLTPEAFNSIVLAVSQYPKSAAKDAFAVLQALLQVPRIGVLIGFMNEAESAAVQAILHSVEGTVPIADLDAVRKGWLGEWK